MKNTKIFIALTLCAVLLLSGCNTDKPAEESTEASAATSNETTAAASETETTTAEMTAEPEEKAPEIYIKPTGPQRDERTLRSSVVNGIEMLSMDPYSWSYSTDDQYDYCFSPSGKIWLDGGEFDMSTFEDYPNAEEYPDAEIFHKFTADDGLIPVWTYRGATLFGARESSGIFSLSPAKVEDQIKAMPMTEHRNFRSQYELRWKDPSATVTEAAEEGREFGEIKGLSLACELFDVVKVNAFVCRSDDTHYAILIDPAYMQGIPMFSNGNTRFDFGGKVVMADSVLLYSFIDDAYAEWVEEFPENAYAYAQVTLFETQIAWDHDNGYESGKNYCVLSEMHILDTFTKIEDFEYPGDKPVIDTVLSDAKMSLYYGALSRAYSEIYSDDIIGIELVDLDFDDTPELIVSRLDSTGDVWWFDWKFDADVYRFSDTSVKKIGTLPLDFVPSDTCRGYYIGTGVVPDDSDAWFATFRESPSPDEDFGRGDYAFALADDKIYYFPCFTEKPAGDDALVISGQKQEKDYFFMGIRIEPTVDNTDPVSYDGATYDPLLEWNEVTADYGGIYMLYNKAREEYCKEMIKNSVCIADGEFSNVMTHRDAEKYTSFEFDEAAFDRVVAREVYNWCSFGNGFVPHRYAFIY